MELPSQERAHRINPSSGPTQASPGPNIRPAHTAPSSSTFSPQSGSVSIATTVAPREDPVADKGLSERSRLLMSEINRLRGVESVPESSTKIPSPQTTAPALGLTQRGLSRGTQESTPQHQYARPGELER